MFNKYSFREDAQGRCTGGHRQVCIIPGLQPVPICVLVSIHIVSFAVFTEVRKPVRGHGGCFQGRGDKTQRYKGGSAIIENEGLNGRGDGKVKYGRIYGMDSNIQDLL